MSAVPTAPAPVNATNGSQITLGFNSAAPAIAPPAPAPANVVGSQSTASLQLNEDDDLFNFYEEHKDQVQDEDGNDAVQTHHVHGHGKFHVQGGDVVLKPAGPFQHHHAHTTKPEHNKHEAIDADEARVPVADLTSGKQFTTWSHGKSHHHVPKFATDQEHQNSGAIKKIHRKHAEQQQADQ
jgi:hypothetical protein